MNLGLLGAIGGLGQGLQQAGTTLFNDEILKRREQRLQAIRDKEYSRNRQDQLADQQTSMGFQQSERIAGQGYQDKVREDNQNFASGESDKSQEFQKELAEYKMGAYSTFELGKDGRIYGLNSKGESKAIAGFEGELVSFTDLTSLSRSAATSLSTMLPDTDEYKELIQFQGSLQRAIDSKLQSAGISGSDEPTPEFLSTLPRLTGVDGREYVQYQGNNYLVGQ